MIDSGFALKIADATATVELPVLADGTAEGLETATFKLIDSEGATINPDTNEATLTLADSPAQVPVTQEFDSNDTIAQALDLNLNPENLSTTVKGRISSEEPGEIFVPGFGSLALSDFSEDVDFYTFELNAGDTLTIDLDAVGSFETLLHPGIEQRLDSELRLFDANGNELASVNNAAAPDEELSRDPYLEFTASETGTYYMGVSQLGNRNYDPNVENSGSGWIFPEIGVHVGEYDLNVSVTPTSDEGRFFGTPGEDIFDSEISSEGFNGSNDLVFAGVGDDLIDTSAASGGNRLYGQAGDDDLFLGSRDHAFGGIGDDSFFLLGGDNILTGEAGADEFWIAAGELPAASNTITDFELGMDILGIGGLNVGFEDLTLTQQKSNTLIASGEKELALLLGINSNQLSADNFLFA